MIEEHLVEKLADLARLDLAAAEREAIRSDLTAILAMVEKLRELDTDAVSPLTHLTEAENALRPDRPGPVLDRQEALANAPDTDGQHFRLPKVIDL